MRTVILDPVSAGLAGLLEQRRRSGLDRFDEVWEGVLHVVPAPSGEHAHLSHQLSLLLDEPARAAGLFVTIGGFNLGDSETDYRVPDGGLHRHYRGVWHTTAPLVLEIVSPADESWEKLTFYAAHHVDEVLIIEPARRSVEWLALEGAGYRAVDHSRVIDLGVDDMARRIDWP
jgi:Uma2 family endonuclease